MCAAMFRDGHRHYHIVGHVHTQKTACTDVMPSDRDGSVHSIVLHVHGGVTVKIFSSVQKMKTILCFGKLLNSCFDISDFTVLLETAVMTFMNFTRQCSFFPSVL